MNLLDTNIFVIDRFFRRDDRYGHNSQLISIFPQIEVGFSIFSLLELCGISSFNLSTLELRRWNPKDFSSRIPLPVMTPVEFLAQRRRKQ